MEVPFQNGDPVGIREFAMRTYADSDAKEAIRKKRDDYFLGPLFEGFNSPGGGTAAQAVNAQYLNPLGSRLVAGQRMNGDNNWSVAALYESSDAEYKQIMAAPAADAGAPGGGAIETAILPPSAQA